MTRLLLLFILFGSVPAPAVDFERDIRPLLQKHCVECHGTAKQKGSLRLDAKSLAFRGGDHGKVIVPGGAAASPLWKKVVSTDEDERMPPKGPALPEVQANLLRDWLNNGAVWPENQADRDAAVDRRLRHWSFQAVREPPVPRGQKAFARNEIDAFILARLEEKLLKPAPEADRRTLIRRLSFDLLGLPPTPDEVESFLSDADPEAYEKLVDRLLDSPHYGERWARHWLDIAHYADTHGFERDQLRPNAWHYRDYVIAALNADKPYDQFLREQLAGDLLAPERPEAVIATGFLAAGPWDFVGQVETKSDMLRRAARAGDLDDMVTQVMTSTMGLTINCARCHDHKLDPITQEEYYRLWSVFAGVRRGERPIDTALEKRRSGLESQIRAVTAELAGLMGVPLDLADMVGGGNGRGTGKKNAGLNLSSGALSAGKVGYQRDVAPNRLIAPKPGIAPFVRGVFLPMNGPVALADRIVLKEVPKTSGHAWDLVRNGLLNSQVHALAGAIDYASNGHSILGLHANAAVTFDLQEIRRAHELKALQFHAVAACGAGADAKDTLVDFSVFVDGTRVKSLSKLKKNSSTMVEVTIPNDARFLTLMAADGGDGIGHDLFFLGDPRLIPADTAQPLTVARQQRVNNLRKERGRLEKSLAALGQPARMYGIVTEPPPVIRVQRRGNPEDAQQEVSPGALACVRHGSSDFGNQTMPEDARRLALARWITDPANPLTSRVLVNRLWHHHFGQGLVNTPSDFGLGGDRPSHPQLLDWLATEFLRSGWSLKAMHRLICTSGTYRQSSAISSAADRLDASNRLLWRQSPRRLDAESLRDAVLFTSGKLNLTPGGPGFRDFDYTEAYAPIYRYITPDKPELWRRSIYRFVVRTTPHQFLTTLDCPDPANLTPARVTTTTALQALALSNNDFMLTQAAHFAARVQNEAGHDIAKQVLNSFEFSLQRPPTSEELVAAHKLVKSNGLQALCRMLLNSNEFVYVD